ncbi:hypothetical protein FRC19_009190 [Serendipita sp. 401]|nr:hypothetical protein FRC19_009190 [Serendipita sp. 401]KAG9058411.1 hypothetical protein FS842_009479 [Serendipita sp. 407]
MSSTKKVKKRRKVSIPPDVIDRAERETVAPKHESAFGDINNATEPPTATPSVANGSIGKAAETKPYNRTPSDEERLYIQMIIAEDDEELQALVPRIARRQQAADLSSKTVSSIEETIKVLEYIQSVRQNRVEANTSVQAMLNSDYVLPLVPDVVPQLGCDVPKLQEITFSHHEEIDRARALVREGITELDNGRRWLLELNHRLVAAKSRLEEQTKTLDSMNRYARTLRREISRRRKLISAFKRFPREILEKIFEDHILDEIDAIRNDPSRPQSRAVITLSSVCATWRQIISEVPSLWVYIPLIRPCEHNLYQIKVNRISAYLNSQRPRKHIVLDWPMGGTWSWSDLSWSSQVTTITDPVKYAFENSPIVSQALKHLPSIEILGKTTSGVQRTVECPSISESYCFTNIFPILSTASASAVQTLVLDLPSPDWSQISRLLQSLSHIKTLKVSFKDEKWPSPPTGNGPFTFQYLSQLSGSLAFLATLLESTTSCPGLRKLGLYTAENGKIPDTDKLGQLLRRLSFHASISTLNFLGSPSIEHTKDQLSPLLQVFTSVDTVRVEGPFMSPLIECLVADPQVAGEVKHIALVKTSDIKDDLLRQLVVPGSTEETPKSVRTISSITLDHCTGITQSFCEEARILIDKLVVYC